MAWRKNLSAIGFLATLAAAGTALGADAPPKRFGLDMNPGIRKYYEQDADETVSRRVITHLVPMIEAMGYSVTQVHDGERAVVKGGYHASISVTVYAKPMYLVHSATKYGDHLEADYDTGVSARGTFCVYGGPRKRLVAYGELEPVESLVHDAGGRGRPVFDDEDAVARRYAQTVAEVITEALRGL